MLPRRIGSSRYRSSKPLLRLSGNCVKFGISVLLPTSSTVTWPSLASRIAHEPMKPPVPRASLGFRMPTK